MKLLLTGSTGFLGKALHAYLTLNTDWEVLRPTREEIAHGLPNQHHADYLVNLASLSSVEQSVEDPKSFINQNVQIALNTLEWARRFPPSVFLQFSSVEVNNVTNPYAASKAAQEEIAEAYWKTFDVPVVIARSSNIIGPGQNREKFVPNIIERIKQAEPVTIYETAGKQGERVYNTVENVCSAILFMLQKYPFDQTPSKEHDTPIHYDIDGGRSLTNLEMAEMVARRLKVDLDYEIIEPKSARPTYAGTLPSIGIPLSLEGWRPPQSLEEGLSWIA